MRLKRIYASKLYVTSTRKDRIHAAIQDPINAELVQQLSDYLDDNAYAELEYAVKQEEAEKATTEQDTGAGVSAPSGSGSSGHGGGSFAPSSFSGDVMSDFGEDELVDTPDGGGEAPAEDVEEAIEVKGKPITATSMIWTTLDDVVANCDTIKGTLNAREDTSGVTRLQVVEHELWIYYNDDSNLNDKMIEVIGVLNATGYTYLKFNRLARSNNAIVFDILLSNTEEVKSIKDIEEETE